MKRPKNKHIFIFTVVILLLASAFFLLKLRIYFSGQYDHEADYNYNFDTTLKGGTSVAISVRKDHFLWPNLPQKYDTGFLKIRLKATFSGMVSRPYLETAVNGEVIKQYFEFGAGGIRYINISPLLGARVPFNAKVSLKAQGVFWDSQDSNLVLFKNDSLAYSTILIISPHPDDAEIAAFGFYGLKDTSIVTITQGAGGDNRYADFFHMADKHSPYLLKAKIRTIDSIFVPYIGGVSPIRSINLAYPGGQLRAMHKLGKYELDFEFANVWKYNNLRDYNLDPEFRIQPVKLSWSELVRDLTVALEKFRPDIIVAPHPLLDFHADHQYSAVAVFEALKRSRAGRDGKLYLYTNHQSQNPYYPFGPSDSIISLPPNFTDLLKMKIYSLNLTPGQQIEKRFALDAMHDLRYPPRPPDLDWYYLADSTARLAKLYFKTAIGFDESYLRRALRPNELFFVYDFDDAEALLYEFSKESGMPVEVFRD